MAKIAAVTGILLIGLGIAGYVLTPVNVADGLQGEIVEQKRSVTALIPAFIGIPILLCGCIGLMKPSFNKYAIHGAAVFGLLGALAATGRGVMSLVKLIDGDGDFNQRAFVFITLMGVICWMLVIACIMSFINARKQRQKNEAAEVAGTGTG